MILTLPLFGSKTAIKWGKQELTYNELNKQANRLAQAFIRNGVGVETPVALILSNCIEYAISDIAIIKAGAVKVPLKRHAWRARNLIYVGELTG